MALKKQDVSLRNLMLSDDDVYIHVIYRAFLGRDPDIGGLQSYRGKLRRGMGRVAVLRDIANSSEARTKELPVSAEIAKVLADGIHPFILEEMMDLPDRAFIQLAYSVLLNREIDESGLETNLRALAAGRSRLFILWQIRKSEEGRRINANVPGLDDAIRHYRRSKIPLVGRFLSHPSRSVTESRVAASLRRIERDLGEFRASNTGQRLVAATRDAAGSAIMSHRHTGLSQMLASASDSVKVAGNVALPAQVMTDGFPVERIVMLKLDHIGDFFISIRAMTMIREAWPDAHITLVSGPWNVGMAEKLGIFDRIVPYSFFAAKTGAEEFNWDAADWLARCDGVRDLDLGSFDVAIDFRHDTDTRPCLTRIEAKLRVGFASPGGPLPPTPPLDLALLEIPSNHREQLHAESRLISLASLVVETLKPPARHPIRRLVENSSAMELPFGGIRPYAVFAPGAGSPNRTWPPENFVALMERVRDEIGLGLVLVGGPGEAEVNGGIAALFSQVECQDMTGGKLTDLPTILDAAALYVGNDTSGGHLAAMLGTPTLSIYAGVSDPRVWQPLGDKVSIVHSQTPCSYCHINLRKDCHHELRCLSEITVEDAFAELRRLHTRFPDRDMVSTSVVA